MSSRPVVILLLLACTRCQAWLSCSKSSDSVKCEPCGESDVFGFKCPRQCGNELSSGLCDVVCSDLCTGSQCEYDSTGALVCTGGCIDHHTGPYCQDTCPGACLQCTQEGQCLKCPEGKYGDTCASSCSGCNGGLCDISGKCMQGCKPGFYGAQCQNKCSTCKSCKDGDAGCEVCDINGTCLQGCSNGYYGGRCDRKCHAKCAQCDKETGACRKCNPGWFGKWCKSECKHCKNALCDYKTGKCLEGCKPGYRSTGNTCAVVPQPPQEAKDPEKKKALSGLATIFGEEDYMLPIVGCLVVLCAVIAVVIVWRCRNSRLKDKGTDKHDVEDGLGCNGVNTHPPVRRNSSIHIPLASPYKEIVEEAIRTHSCEEILKKHNLLDPDRHKLSPTENKSLASLRNRTGNLSMPFMTPIAEDEEDEPEEVTEDDGVHMPNVGIIFTLEPPSDDDDGADTMESAISSQTGTPERDSILKKGVVPEIVITDESGEAPAEVKDIYILQTGAHNYVAGRAVSFDNLDTSHSSGGSTPKVPDMYKHPHEGHNRHFSALLSDHLDTFLSDRSGQEANQDTDATEKDVLLEPNNNQNVSKLGNLVPRAFQQRNCARAMQMSNGDTGIELEEVSFSERDRMLSHSTA